MVTSNVSLSRDSAQIAALLDSPEIAALISELEATRWTGRPGYPIRAMVGLALVKSLYCLPTWTRAVALVRDHAGLRDVLGAVPSTDAAYRFTVKLREHKDVLARVHHQGADRIARREPENGKCGRN
jgi:hypothetical protein